MNMIRGHPNLSRLSYNYCMRSPEGKFRQKRHPLCPECRYDLIATVDSGSRICPECGYEFELSELRGEKRPGEWSPGRGLMIAAFTTLIRAILILPIWTGLIWFISPALTAYPLHFRAILAIIAIFAIPGIIIGYCFSYNLTEKAGFVSSFITAFTSLTAIFVIYGGVTLSQIFRPLPGWIPGALIVVPMAFAVTWIIKKTLLDD